MPIALRLALAFAALIAAASVLAAPARDPTTAGAATDSSAAAAPNPATTKPQAAVAADVTHTAAFAVRLRMLEDGAVPGPLIGILDIQNSTEQTLRVQKVTVIPYGRLGGIYGTTVVYQGEVALETKRWSNPLEVRLLQPEKSLSPYQVATAKTGPVEFLVAIEFTPAGKTTRASESTLTTAVVGTSPAYIFLGAVCGAFLLVLFMWATKVVDSARTGTWPLVAARAGALSLKWGVMALAYTLNGLVVAVILWTLASGLTTFQLPISFQLRDFSGGLIAGLFSGMLAKSISDRLTSNEKG